MVWRSDGLWQLWLIACVAEGIGAIVGKDECVRISPFTCSAKYMIYDMYLSATFMYQNRQI